MTSWVKGGGGAASHEEVGGVDVVLTAEIHASSSRIGLLRHDVVFVIIREINIHHKHFCDTATTFIM